MADALDVVAITYDPNTRRVLMATHTATSGPGPTARGLPRIVADASESVESAVRRALRQVDIEDDPTAVGTLPAPSPQSAPGVPANRTAGLWATFWHSEAIWTAETRWVPIERHRSLAFDQNLTVTAAREMFAEKIWHDADFTRGLTGIEFSTVDADAISAALIKDPVEPDARDRILAGVNGLTRAGECDAAGGPPPPLWRWTR